MHAQSVSVPIATILLTILSTFDGFGHILYILQTSTFQNIAKLLIHQRISEYLFIYLKKNFGESVGSIMTMNMMEYL